MPGDPWLIGTRNEAERATDPERRKREGAYYTPRWLAEALVERALAPLIDRKSIADLEKLRILDPAVGGGIFLLAAIDLLATNGLDRRVAAACCHGIDRDPAAALASTQAITLHAGPPGSLRVADSLLEAPRPIYDAVIGNPPWEKIAKSDPRRPYFDQAFADVRQGEINLHALFLVQSWRWLAPGGRFALLTPGTWLVNRWDEFLRHFILEAGVTEVALLPPGTFGATPITIPALVVGTKGVVSASVRVSAPGHQGIAQAARWRARPLAQMSVFDDEALASIESRAFRSSIPLGDVARASDGIYTSTARLAATPAREALTDRPILLSGAEIGRDVILHRGFHAPEALWNRYQGIHEHDRLVLHAARNPTLARRLVGAVVPAGVYTSNRFINLVSDLEDPYFLAAILLSTPIDGLFGRRFPVADVDAFMLHQLPIPKTGRAARKRLAQKAKDRASLVKGLIGLITGRLLLGQGYWPRDVLEIGRAVARRDAEVDAEVLDLFGLGPEEARLLRNRGISRGRVDGSALPPRV